MSVHFGKIMTALPLLGARRMLRPLGREPWFELPTIAMFAREHELVVKAIEFDRLHGVGYLLAIFMVRQFDGDVGAAEANLHESYRLEREERAAGQAPLTRLPED